MVESRTELLAPQRQDQILARLRRVGGGARVRELAESLVVSEMTVRRDLDALASRGLVEKVHGGAVLAGRGVEEPGFAAKSVLATTEKAEIARRAAQLVQPGSAVAISGGTTTWALARELAAIQGITVVTNSIQAWLAMRELAPAQVQAVLTGGTNLTPSDALVGPIADNAIRSLSIDLLFLGVHGMDPEAGLSTPNVAEAETNRVLISRARRVVVVADHTKWRTVALCTIAPLSISDVLITDSGLAQSDRQELAYLVGELIVVAVPGSEG